MVVCITLIRLLYTGGTVCTKRADYRHVNAPENRDVYINDCQFQKITEIKKEAEFR